MPAGAANDTDRPTCPFDHHDPDFRFEFRDVFARLRETAPIAWTEAHGGFWVVSSYPLVRRIAQDAATFTVAPGPDRTGGLRIPTPPGLKTRPLFVPGEADGEEHDRYRLALNPHFSKARVAQMAPMIERHVQTALVPLLDRDEFDVVDELIQPILAGVACEHLGLEVDEPRQLFRTMHQMVGTIGPNFDQVKMAFEGSWSQLANLVRSRRDAPGDDIISALVTNRDPEFTNEEVEMMTLNVILGAFHTTSSLLAQVIMHLDQDPALRDLLRERPELIPKAVDEFLRLKAVTIALARTATRDVEIEGVSIKQGDRLLLSFASANHDPVKYANPTEFDLERGAAQQLGMGVGTHFCLGAWLAKSITGTTIQAILDRTDHLAVDHDRVVLAGDITNTFGIEHVPARAVPSGVMQRTP